LARVDQIRKRPTSSRRLLPKARNIILRVGIHIVAADRDEGGSLVRASDDAQFGLDGLNVRAVVASEDDDQRAVLSELVKRKRSAIEIGKGYVGEIR
jgi:soluble P-type ATPase